MLRPLLFIYFFALVVFPTASFAQVEGRLVSAFPRLTFEKITDIQFSSDTKERFVVEKVGVIYQVYKENRRFKRRRVLRLTPRLSLGGNEQGLLGMALDPRFAENGHIYLNYTDSTGSTQISRFTRKDSRFPLQSELKILTVTQPFRNHNGGAIHFGPDRMLYIALGDGGSARDPQGNGQNRATLLGKILRINVRNASVLTPYAIPSDNPFVGNTAGHREEIYAYGLRNPWRMSFDSKNGELWAADVGQNMYEEVNIIQSGGNYGWAIREGQHPFAAGDCTHCIEPVTEYDHTEGFSITGGYRYRGSRLPEISGAYLFADFVSGTFWTYAKGERSVFLQSDISPSCFGQDWKNELFVADYVGGKVYRIALLR